MRAEPQEIDVKRYAKVEKIQGGELTDCKAGESGWATVSLASAMSDWAD